LIRGIIVDNEDMEFLRQVKYGIKKGPDIFCFLVGRYNNEGVGHVKKGFGFYIADIFRTKIVDFGLKEAGIRQLTG
jgi:hypothetical protein